MIIPPECECGCGLALWGVPRGQTRLPDHLTRRERLLKITSLERSLYNGYVQKCQARSTLHTFNLADYVRLTRKKCFFCGSSPTVLNGLARKDFDRGFSDDNVVVCCAKCSQMRGDRTVEAFLRWVVRVVEFQRAA